jgi:hypothetical protein
MSKREQVRRAAYFTAFEATVVRNRPELAGRIQWSEVEYGCLTGADPEKAALSYLSRREGK